MGWEVEEHSHGQRYEPGRYDPDNYYVHSTDTSGHHTSIRLDGPLSIPPYLAGLINQMVQDERYPKYTSVQAVVRDWLVHGAQHHAERSQDELLQGVITHHVIRHQIVERREDRVAMEKAFSEIRGHIQELRDSGIPNRTIRPIIDDFIRSMRAGCPLELLKVFEEQMREFKAETSWIK